MGLTNKERCHRHMQNLKQDPEKHAEYLAKEKERYRKRKDRKQIKSVKDLSETGKRKQRRQWKINQRNSRKKRKDITNFLAFNSPPTSPVAEVADPYGARERARRKVRKDRASAYRNIENLKKQVKVKQTKTERYKKRCQRLQKKLNITINKPLPLNVRRTLKCHDSLLKRIKSSSSANKRKLLDYQVLRKYHLLRHTSRSTGITYKGLTSTKKRSDRPAVIFIQNAKKHVYHFLHRDDNSRIKPGKKDTITRKKVKKQKRLLSDSLKNLHLKFLSQFQMKISYSLFCKLRPFWILPPTLSDRQTCLCKIHENLTFKSEKLYSLKVISSPDLHVLSKQITCDINSKKCMYRECSECSWKKLSTSDFNPGQQVCWQMWVSRREEKNIAGETFSCQITKKVEEQGTMEYLLEQLNSDLSKGCRHLYNISHQYKVLRELMENLNDNEGVVHIDFSENYNCKYTSEIQSVHFGASHEQATLHTGMLYTTQGKLSFCSISSVNKHNPASIWAHLNPVLKHLKSQFPLVNTVHFISDGPTTQYRNKKNFHLFCNRLYGHGFTGGSWNFLEAGHGKGAADGVGAAVKRMADSIVKSGTDIPDGGTLYKELKASSTGVKIFTVSGDDITGEEAYIPDDLHPIKGTMLLHQLVTQNRGELLCRNVSCFCEKPSECDCFEAFRVSYHSGAANVEETSGSLKFIREITEQLKGQWCVVEYDQQPYPGIIQDVRGGEAEVKVMHKIGNNRFFWPNHFDDVIWYEQEHLITLIEPPTLVTKRHHQIEKEAWMAIQKYLDDKYTD